MKLNEAGMKYATTLASMDEVVQLATPPAFEMTQHNYGHYAQVIGQLGAMAMPDDVKGGHYIAAEAFKLAGGNAKGIDAAMCSMFGYSDYDPLGRMLG